MSGRVLCVDGIGALTGPPCANATGYTTIQAAVNAASTGDEIRVAQGTYSNDVSIDNTHDGLRFRGAYPAGVAGWQEPNSALSTTISGQIGLNAAVDMANLVLAGGVDASSSPHGTIVVTASGTLTWTAGTLSGYYGSTVLSVAPGSTLHLDGPAGKGLSSGRLANMGTTEWTGRGNLVLSGAADNPGVIAGVIDNSGLFEDRTDASILPGCCGGTRFANSGTFRKLESTGVTTVTVPLNTSGVVDVRDGTLRIDTGNGSSTGPFTIASGGSLLFNNYRLDAGTSISGAGVAQVQAGNTLNLGGNVPVQNFLLAGSVNDQNSGQGSLVITPTGVLTWTSGALNGYYGSTLLSVAAGASLRLGGPGAKGLNAARLANAGTVEWTGGDLTLAGAADNPGVIAGVIDNSGLFEDRTDASILPGCCGGTRFANSGTFRKLESTGVTTVTVPLNNTGHLAVRAGTLALGNGHNSSGVFIDAGAALACAPNNSFTFGDGTTTSGDGAVQADNCIVADATNSYTASIQIRNIALTQGGALHVNEPLTVTNVLTWTSGTVLGDNSNMVVTIPASATVALTGSGSKALFGNSITLDNQGAIAYTGSGFGLGDATLLNRPGAFLDIHADVAHDGNDHLGTIANQGTLTSSGPITVDAVLNNTGHLHIRDGMLTPLYGLNSSSILIDAGAALACAPNKSFTFGSGTTTTGDGVVQADNCTVQDPTTSTPPPPFVTMRNVALTQGGGFSLYEPLTVTNVMTWTAGGLYSDGDHNQYPFTIVPGATLTLSGNGDKQLYGRTVVNHGTIKYTGSGFAMGESTLTNEPGATLDIHADIGQAGNNSLGTIANQGSLTATATITANLTNAGRLSLGSTPEVLTINGTYTQQSAGTLAVKIGGRTVGADYDQLSVSGNVSLGGTLAVSMTKGFQPAAGDSFMVLACGSCSGTFSTVTASGLGAGTSFTTAYNPNNVTLTVNELASPTPTLTSTPSSTTTGTPTSTSTDTPTTLPTNTPTSAPSPTPTGTATATPTDTAMPPSPTATSTMALAPSSTATSTVVPPAATMTRAATPMATATSSSTSSPKPTSTPTIQPPTAGLQPPTAVPQARISALPSVTNPGGLLTVTGSGFGPGEMVRVGLHGVTYASVMAAADGSLPPTGFAVPLAAALGPQTVFAQGSTTQRRAEATVTVLPVNPVLLLDHTTTKIGAHVCASGTAFLAGESVTLAVDSVAVATIHASPTGSFTACFAMPGVIVDGANELTALGAGSRSPAVVPFSGLVSPPSTFYFAGASTASGDETELAIVNPQLHSTTLTLRFYPPVGSSFAHSVTMAAHSRITLPLSVYMRGVRGFGLRLQADWVVAAQMVVRRAHRNPYTSLGTGLLTTRWYLAEGYTGLSFHETIDVLNPNTSAATVQVRLLPLNGRGARGVRVRVAARHAYRLDVNTLYRQASLAAMVTSSLPTCVERVLTFGDGGYGASGNVGTPQAATTWLFAEGAGAGRLQTFLTILNPGRQAATATAVFNDLHGHALGVRTVVVQGLHRGNIRLNDTTHAGAVATTLTSDVPVVVERPFYLGNPNRGRTGASLVYGRNGTGTRWTFPAGDTMSGNKEDLLVLNPTAGTLSLRAAFYLASGHVMTRLFSVAPEARFTLHVNSVPPLMNTQHGIQLSATNGRSFVAEQSIYNGDSTTLYGTAGLAQ